jgi:hypothetical protein
VDPLQEPNLRRQQSARTMSYSCAQRLISIFGATYSCEGLYPTLKFFELQYRSDLTNEHVTKLVRAALNKYNKIRILLKLKVSYASRMWLHLTYRVVKEGNIMKLVAEENCVANFGQHTSRSAGPVDRTV